MKSPLDELLRCLGGHYDEAAGPEVPIHFGDTAGEYDAACRTAAVADRSTVSKIELRGPDRTKFLNNLTTNDIRSLAVGRGRESFLTTAQGRILAYVRVWATADSLWIDTVPGAAPGILNHLERYHITEKVEFADRTAEFAQLLLVGPNASRILTTAAGNVALELSDLQHTQILISRSVCHLRRHNWLGLPGYELTVAAGQAADLWQTIWQAGQPVGLRAMGQQAYEILRIEAGVPLYDVDIDNSNFPQEVGRDNRSISFTKGCYLGQETVARIDALGHVNRHLVGLELSGQREAPPRAAAMSVAGKTIGQITSAVYSPALACAIALGYVRRGYEQPGTEVVIDSGGRTVAATVHALPFVSHLT